MALHPSGSNKEVELVKVEASQFTLVIKGKPFHERYLGLREYRSLDVHELMEGQIIGDIESIYVFDIHSEQLVEVGSIFNVRPIFFEYGQYQILIIPKGRKELQFFHEHPLMRNAVGIVDTYQGYFLLGTLQFQNEVGFTKFEIRSEDRKLLSVILEIFPSKLDYKNDYYQLLEEVNEEIYNLAFHFIRKTYQKARIENEKKPSKAEFFRLLQTHVKRFIQTIERIEKRPYQHLNKTYQHVRADRIKKQDPKTTKFMATRPHLFIKSEKGIPVGDNSWLPVKGLTVIKRQITDNHENQYIKFLMVQLFKKLKALIKVLTANINDYNRGNKQILKESLSLVELWARQLEVKLRNEFWIEVSLPKSFELPLVLQMASGYRDAFQLYLLLTKGLSLHGNLYQLSLKDVALLYEYWTFLKMGQLLSKKYDVVSQDIVKVNQNGLFVHLEQGRQAKRVFRHSQTNEEITLIYQRKESRLPTSSQEPDSTLLVEKKGIDYTFNYIFDAKYRINFDTYSEYSIPGPEEDDINTMHRYRDAIVAESGANFERTSFGAYVLFPWSDEGMYQEHKFYKSIEKVNIGGLPFLPNSTSLVENLVEQIIEKSAEELQRDGILPFGAQHHWKSELTETVLVGKVNTQSDYQKIMKQRNYQVDRSVLKAGWQEAKYIALYLTKTVGLLNGIKYYGKIRTVDVSDFNYVSFEVEKWLPLKKVIEPVGYGISTYVTTTLSNLENAKELPEIFVKKEEELTIWRMVRRLSDQVKVTLDTKEISDKSTIKQIAFNDIIIDTDTNQQTINVVGKQLEKKYSFDELLLRPSMIFKCLVGMMEEK